ncbi:MAG TPA: hypothetical protein VEX38_06670, partial [Fimbriimonadaceae bacterium]|nr:hypothetical protein [Fimbriimonadaceae bacterium]
LGTPDLLILDEVTSGVDPIWRQELRGILKERAQAGCTLFFSSHELSEVEMLCDRILVIHKGRLLEERQVSALKKSLSRYEITYAGYCSMLDLTDDWSEIEKSKVFRARFNSKDRLLAAVDRIHREHGTIIDLTAEEGSLEEYFVETIRRAA